MDSGKRLTAVKVSAKDLVSGEFIGAGRESLLRTKNGAEVSKVRLMGTVIDKYVSEKGNYGILTLDDSTETIQVRFFREDVPKINGFEAGDIVDVLGFVRQYENETYISPKILKKIEDPNWEMLRRLELAGLDTVSESTAPADISGEVLEKIRELDNGDGITLEVLLENLNNHDSTQLIESVRELLFRGELFEPRKGVLKIV